VIVVLDTNVFVSACLGKGASADTVAACIEQRHQALMGAALLAEYEDVLGRDGLFEGCRLSRHEREELLEVLLAQCRWTRIYFGWRPNLPDEGDNHLVELAVAGGASAIITHNVRHLRSMELHFPDISVLTPAQFLKTEDPT
jgi:uncharacterized protein